MSGYPALVTPRANARGEPKTSFLSSPRRPGLGRRQASSRLYRSAGARTFTTDRWGAGQSKVTR